MRKRQKAVSVLCALFLLFLAGLPLSAGEPDEIASYFRVSANDAVSGEIVVVYLFLRDKACKPATAKSLEIVSSNPKAKVLQEPQPVSGKPGEYLGKIQATGDVETNLTIKADGKIIRENVIFDGGSFEQGSGRTPAQMTTYANWYDATFFGWGAPAFRGEKGINVINFDKGKSVYWGFGNLSGDALPRNHKYVAGIYTKYENVHGERGVSMQVTQRDDNDNVTQNKYCGFLAGTSEEWVLIESEPIDLHSQTTKLSTTALILAGGGKAWFDEGRLRLIPTVRWGASKRVTAVSNVSGRCLMPRITYELALKKDFEECQKELAEKKAAYGEKDKGVRNFQKALLGWKEQLDAKPDAETAYAMQLDMNLKREELQKAAAQAAMRQLEGGDEEDEEEEDTAPAFPQTISGAVLPLLDKVDVTVDGSMDEAFWKDALVLEPFYSAETHEPAKIGSRVHLLADGEKLYMLWEFDGAPAAAPVPDLKNDDPALFSEETAEFFFGNPEQPSAYSQFAVTPDNHRWDALDRDSYINFQWESKAVRNAKGWSLEMAIPWKELGVSPQGNPVFRVNFARSRHSADQTAEGACWSIVTRGYGRPQEFGFLVVGSPEDAFAKELKEIRRQAKPFAKDKRIVSALSALFQGAPEEVVDFQNRMAAARKAITAAQNKNASQELSQDNGNAQLLLGGWDEAQELEAAPEFQIPLLVSRVKAPVPPNLQWKMAVNEFAHRALLVSALKPLAGIQIQPSDLLAKDGKKISAENVRIYKIGYLRPVKELWPSQFNQWSGRPLPELVEEVDAPFSLGKFESAHIRVLIDSTDAQPGSYEGTLTVQAEGQPPQQLPLSCEVLPIVLPDSKTHPLWIYVFTGIPYPGDSGRAWAKLFREHYVTDISFETPRMHLNGQLIVPPPHIKDSKDYIHKMTNPEIDFGAGKVVVDGEYSFLSERLRICAEYGLKPVFSTRTEDIYPEAFPAVVEYLKEQGIGIKDFYYKTGDEDTSLWQLPLAEKLHQFVPELQLLVYPSGQEYFDMKPMMAYYTHFGFTRSGLSNPKFEPDIRAMQAAGKLWMRYTNRTSWAERDVRYAGRQDPWAVLLADKMDGYAIWTAGVTSAWLGYRYAYGDAKRCPVHDYPPEQQSICQLVYVRKQGDFFKPIGSIRLEHMRDGLTDVLYYREAEKALRKRNDPAAEAKLKAVANMPKNSAADFEAIREKLIALILGK